MSAYSVSIGTSLAMESIAVGPQPPYDPLREIPHKINLSDYQEFWVNAHTLFRNLIGAMEGNAIKAILPGDAALALESEIEIIRTLVKEESKGQAKLVVYASQYKDLKKAHPYGKIREAKTELQILTQDVTQASINALFHRMAKGEAMVFDRALQPVRPVKALILTHYAYDLLSHRNFKELVLLESHTGALKAKSLWYTKLTEGKNLVRVPWGPYAMQLFGDSSTFLASPIAWRKEWLELCEKFKINQGTTLDRLIFLTSQIKTPEFKEMMNKTIIEFKSF